MVLVLLCLLPMLLGSPKGAVESEVDRHTDRHRQSQQLDGRIMRGSSWYCKLTGRAEPGSWAS